MQVSQEVASPGNCLRSTVFTRYLRKAFFPKHQDLQFAGKAGGGADLPFSWIIPQTLRHCCAVEKTGPGRARPVPGGKQQVCSRPGTRTRPPRFLPYHRVPLRLPTHRASEPLGQPSPHASG